MKYIDSVRYFKLREEVAKLDEKLGFFKQRREAFEGMEKFLENELVTLRAEMAGLEESESESAHG